MALGQGDDAARQGRHVENVGLAGCGEPEEHQLGAAAADVEHQRMARAAVQQGDAAGKRELGLLVAADDVERDPGFGAHAAEERIAIGGAPAASVATPRMRVTPWRRVFPAQTFRARSVRWIAASLSTPVSLTRSPRRTMREKASMTRNPSPPGTARATSNRQLLVPRSSAA